MTTAATDGTGAGGIGGTSAAGRVSGRAGADLTLPGLLARHVRDRPDATALVDGTRRIGWAELDALGRAAAGWLAAQGIGLEDRVAIWMPNRVEWFALLLGLSRLGAVAVAVNTRFRPAELGDLLERSRARMLVTQRDSRKIDFAGVLGGVEPSALRALECVATVGDGDAFEAHGRPTPAFDAFERRPADVPDRCGPDAVAMLFTTSGTTKGPKLVMHAQRTLAYHAPRVAQAIGLDAPGACLLAALPLCGVFGLCGATAALAAGAPIVVQDVFEERAAVRLVRDHAVTHLFGSDEMFRRMLDATTGDDPFPSARLFGYGAFRADGPDIAREAWARRVPLFGLYGSSEVQALFSIQPGSLPVDERIRGGGLPSSGAEVEVRVRDAETGALLPAGQSGDLEIRAPSNFVGYLDDPAATREAIGEDGFFRTGDLGFLRGDGTFVYETRRGDAMRLGGYLVAPSEIEAELRRLPGVADAQAVPVEIDGQWRCAAFVVPAGGAAPDAGALVAALAGRVASYKVPVRVWPIDAFPTTPSANGTKIQRAKLREMARSRIGEERAAGGAA